MVITGRQRYENGWCFWSEINELNRRLGELRGEEDEGGGRRQKLLEEKGKGAKFSFLPPPIALGSLFYRGEKKEFCYFFIFI
ncbi:hypothetical protein LINPERHAP1_LOCUS19049 [Linum perenne]